MKKSFLILLIVLGGVFKINAQASHQTFENAGFKIKSNCIFTKNTTFIQMAEKQGIDNVLAAYVCGENTENPQIGVIKNIIIYDESANYKNLNSSNYKKFEEGYLNQYISNLEEAEIDYRVLEYLGVKAIEYSFSQQGLPTKAIVFLKDQKSYLIQVGTRNNLQSNYTSLKSSFVVL
jgi:hypothetical protein